MIILSLCFLKYYRKKTNSKLLLTSNPQVGKITQTFYCLLIGVRVVVFRWYNYNSLNSQLTKFDILKILNSLISL